MFLHQARRADGVSHFMVRWVRLHPAFMCVCVGAILSFGLNAVSERMNELARWRIFVHYGRLKNNIAVCYIMLSFGFVFASGNQTIRNRKQLIDRNAFLCACLLRNI